MQKSVEVCRCRNYNTAFLTNQYPTLAESQTTLTPHTDKIVIQTDIDVSRKGHNMWLDNLKEMRKQSGNPPIKAIADKANLPERTVNRIFSGETDNPYADTLHQIVTALGGTLTDIFVDTNVVVSTERIVELKENVEVIAATKDLIAVENDMLKSKLAALTTENEILKRELAHKDELLALHNYYKTHFEQLLKRGDI